jgi:hypothetical protein
MKDEGLAVETNGHVVGVAVRVRGGFMFFASDPEFKVLEAKVFRGVEMVRRRVDGLVRARQGPKEQAVMEASPNRTPAAIGAVDSNVVLLRPTRGYTKVDPGPPARLS